MMQWGRTIGLVVGLGLMGWSLGAFQNPFRRYVPWEDYANYPIPDDWAKPGEWTYARLMYPSSRVQIDWQFRPNLDWRVGGANWSIDYPRSDRHLAAAVRRLTRIDAKSVEQPINLDDDDKCGCPLFAPFRCVDDAGVAGHPIRRDQFESAPGR
jgi:hypothetical protein